MSTSTLSIEIFGRGLSPIHRSHWGFMISEPDAQFGDLLNVRVIDLERLWYQFEVREGTEIDTAQTEGLYKIAELTSFEQRERVVNVITNEPAPRDGRRRCQEWIVHALISLEAEELVPSGTAEFWNGLVGKSADEGGRALRTSWMSERK